MKIRWVHKLIVASTLEVKLQPYVSEILWSTTGFQEILANTADVRDSEFDIAKVFDPA